MRKPLTQRQVDKAYRLFYGEGMTLRMVMKELDCGLYDLSPWLTAPAGRISAEAIEYERGRAASRSPQSQDTQGGDGAA